MDVLHIHSPRPEPAALCLILVQVKYTKACVFFTPDDVRGRVKKKTHDASINQYKRKEREKNIYTYILAKPALKR
jgi:hypothetical protein